MNEFFSWPILATFAGATGATVIVTQFIKNVFAKIPTHFISYVVALLVLFIATGANHTAEDWTGWAIIPLNAVLVSFSANGMHSAVLRAASNNPEEETTF